MYMCVCVCVSKLGSPKQRRTLFVFFFLGGGRVDLGLVPTDEHQDFRQFEPRRRFGLEGREGAGVLKARNPAQCPQISLMLAMRGKTGCLSRRSLDTNEQ